MNLSVGRRNAMPDPSVESLSPTLGLLQGGEFVTARARAMVQGAFLSSFSQANYSTHNQENLRGPNSTPPMTWTRFPRSSTKG